MTASGLVWGLKFDEGWATAFDEGGKEYFPVWPDKPFAEVCATDQWLGSTPSSVSVAEFIEVLLFKLNKLEMSVGIMFTPDGNVVQSKPDQLANDLRRFSSPPR